FGELPGVVAPPSKMQLASSSRLASQFAKGTLVAVPMENLGLKTSAVKLLKALLFVVPMFAANLYVYAESAPQTDALYQALGSEAGINHIVDDLIPLVLADPRIKESFKETNMKRLAKLLKEQFCVLSGGPCTYSGDSMKVSHDKLGITGAQFNALAEDLQIAMEQQHIPSSVQNKLIAKLAPMKRDIVEPKK
ncbi:group 1 truncated hemoglobin, partial [Undibacterium sp. RTI2.1]